MSRFSAIPVLAMGQTLAWAGLYYLFPALLLRWEDAFGWSRTELTLALTLAVLTAAFSAPFAGRLIDRGFGAQLIAGSALFGGILLGILPFVDGLWAFYGLWVAVGVAMSGCLYEPCFAFVTRVSGAQARQRITTITLIAGFASTLAFPTAAALADHFGWRMAVWGFALVVACVAAPLLWVACRTLEDAFTEPEPAIVVKSPSQHGALRKVMRHPAFWVIGAAFSLMALNHGILINHILAILDERQIRADAAVMAASMIGPMQVFGRLMMVVIGERVSTMSFTVMAFAAVGLASGLLMTANSLPQLVAGFVILQGAGYGMTSILRPVVTAELLGHRDFGFVSGILAIPYLGAAAVAPFAGAVLWTLGGYTLVIALTSLMGGAGALAFLVLRRF